MLASVVLIYRYLGRSGLPDKHVALLLLTYVLGFLMVSNIKYPSFKKMQLHRRQPLSALVVAVIMLTVAIAEYRVFFFVGSSLYVLSGPALWVMAALRGESVGDDSNASEEERLEASGGPPVA